MTRNERGFTLVEMIVGCTLLIVILLATLSVMDTVQRRSREVDSRNASSQIARQQVDELARELRNLASPTYAQPEALDRAGPYDIIFKAVNPNGPNAGANDTNVRRMRYCLDTANPDNGRLVVQTQTWTTNVPPTAPSSTACPGAGWGTTKRLATNITNRSGGQERPLFAFDSSQLDAINRIAINVWVDDDVLRKPAGTKLASAVFLRNQNRRPEAIFSAERVSGRTFLLNGSSSTDPEGDQLEYEWFDGTTRIGAGVTLSYTVPTGLAMPRTITLKVFDEAGLESPPATRQVTN